MRRAVSRWLPPLSRSVGLAEALIGDSHHHPSDPSGAILLVCLNQNLSLIVLKQTNALDEEDVDSRWR